MAPRLLLSVMLTAPLGCSVHSKVTPSHGASFVPSHNEPVCFLSGTLPSEFRYTVLGTVSATKRSYGSSSQLAKSVADEARGTGADAVINYIAGQRFKGPLPWRVTAPTAQGTLVKIEEGSPTLDCGSLGGELH